jgi:hypothetical protein
VDTGTVGTVQERALARGAKARARAPHLRRRVFAAGDALLYRGHRGPGEFGRGVPPGVIAWGRRRVDVRLQVFQPPPRVDDPSTDVLDHCSNGGIGGRRACAKAWLTVLVTAIEIHPTCRYHALGDPRRPCPLLTYLSKPHGAECIIHTVARHGRQQGMRARGRRKMPFAFPIHGAFDTTWPAC